MMKNIISRNGLILACFALAISAIVALTHQGTKTEIAEQETKQLLRLLDQVVIRDSYDNELYKHCIVTNSLQFLGSNKDQRAFIAKKGNDVVAIALEAIAPNGYNGNINLLIGLTAQGKVTGVRTLAHQETPGLGDKIEIVKDDWITSFEGMILHSHTDKRWQVKKDGGQFDQFTGATITPRAVVQAVKNTIVYFERNKQQLFTESARCGAIK